MKHLLKGIVMPEISRFYGIRITIYYLFYFKDMISMNLKYSHARELFSYAIEILATSQKDVRYRLYDVSQEIQHLPELDLSHELFNDWREVKKTFKKLKIHKISETRTHTEEKLNIRNITGSKTAIIIWKIYNELHFNEKYYLNKGE